MQALLVEQISVEDLHLIRMESLSDRRQPDGCVTSKVKVDKVLLISVVLVWDYRWRPSGVAMS
jgi:hypothetical protein